MMNLAIWLKKNGFRADQVQTFYPSPMASATAMYHTAKNPLHKVHRSSETVDIVKGEKRRRLHKAFLRYHDANNWPLLRQALKDMGRADLIGNGKNHLIPTYQPAGTGEGGCGSYQSARKKNSSAGNDSVKRTNSKPASETSRPENGTVSRGKNSPNTPSRQPKKGDLLTQHTGLPPRKQRVR